MVAICGSYSTGNVGDKAIGKAIRERLASNGISSQTYSHRMDTPRGQCRILGGGGVLHDYQPDILQRRLTYVRDGGAALGVGAVTVADPNQRDRVSNALDSAAVVTVRDTYSKEILQPLTDTEVTITACPAFTLAAPDAETKHATGVNFRPWFTQSEEFLRTYYEYDVNPEDAHQAYIETAKRIVEIVSNPVFIPFDHHDYWFAKRHLDIPVLDYEYSVTETLKRVSSMSQMVCTRYHSLVFAALCDVPAFAVRYAPKVDELADTLRIPSTTPQEFETPTFEQPRNVDELRQRSHRNFELLGENIEALSQLRQASV